MKYVSIIAAAALVLTSAAPSFAAAKSSGGVCANKALSADDQSACKTALAAAKTKSAKAKVREEYQQKITMAKGAKPKG